MFEQRENEAGYIFYVNKETGVQQNDNPKLLEIVNFIRDQQHRAVKYVVYRCATKLWRLKEFFRSE